MFVMFAVSTFESLIADVHDGDAQGSALATTLANAVAGTRATDGRCTISAIVDASARASTSADVACGTPRVPAHDFHVCHCSHTHAAALSRAAILLSVIFVTAVAPPPHDGRMPNSADRARTLRPPVSLLTA